MIHKEIFIEYLLVHRHTIESLRPKLNDRLLTLQVNGICSSYLINFGIDFKMYIHLCILHSFQRLYMHRIYIWYNVICIIINYNSLFRKLTLLNAFIDIHSWTIHPLSVLAPFSQKDKKLSHWFILSSILTVRFKQWHWMTDLVE